MNISGGEVAASTYVADGLHKADGKEHRQAFTREEYDARVIKVQEDMADRELDVLLVHTPENICYLTGYETSGYFEYQVLAVPSSGAPRLLIRIIEQLNLDEYTWMPDAFIWRDGTDYFEATAQLSNALGLGQVNRVGVECHSWFVTAQVYAGLSGAFGVGQLTDAGRLVERRRLVKSVAEQRYLREAAEVVDRTMDAATGAAAAGERELDVAAAAYLGGIAAGGDYPALPHYVASGERTEIGHPTWTDRRLKEGDIMKLEFLGAKRRYHAGLTRTVHIGRAPEAVRRATARQLDVQDEILADLEPGLSTGEITRRASARLAAAGGSLAKRRLGYSMGIGFPPIAGESQTADFREESSVILEPGMVFHMLAPLTGEIAISDTVLITEGGYERLTQSPRELFEV